MFSIQLNKLDIVTKRNLENGEIYELHWFRMKSKVEMGNSFHILFFIIFTIY